MVELGIAGLWRVCVVEERWYVSWQKWFFVIDELCVLLYTTLSDSAELSGHFRGGSGHFS